MMVHSSSLYVPIRRLHPEFLQEILELSVYVAYNAAVAIERHPCC